MGRYQANAFGLTYNNVNRIYGTLTTTHRGDIAIRNAQNGCAVDIGSYYYNDGSYDYGYIDIYNAGGSSATVSIDLDGYTGVIKAYGFTNLSDRRLKNHIESLDIEESAKFIYELKPVAYRYNDKGDTIHHGFIAQDVEDNNFYDDEWGLVEDNIGMQGRMDDTERQSETYKMITYTELIADLVATVQSLNNRIKELEKSSEN